MRLPIPSLSRGALLFVSFLAFFFGRAAAQTTSIPARITQAVDEKKLVVLHGNVHPLARPEFDQGLVADAQPLKRILLLLQRSSDQETALRQLLDDQQSKSSPNYHTWLTPEQFGQEFGAADADIQAVTQWLASLGFTGIKVGPGRTVIEFSGNVAQVRNAFRTEIHRFVVGGKEYSANAVDPQIPAALAPVVAGVVSLHNVPRKSYARILGQFRRPLGEAGLEPLFTFPNPFNGRNFYGLGPGDFATIYNSKPLIAGGNDGTGQTIAIVGETNISVQDVQQFRTMFSLPANFDATSVVLNGEDPGITSIGEEGEADLDVEWSGAAAPGATVKLVVSASTPASAGIDLSALYIVEHNLAAVMSESYGDCEKDLGTTGNAFYNSLWEQAAAQGITVVLASGDGGSAGCDNFNTQQVATQGLAVSGLASTPFNVSVGGTDLDQVNNWAAYWNPTNDPTGTSARSYIPEIPWNENCAQIALNGCGAGAPNGSVNIVAGSGGASSVYGKPTWQMGVAGVPNDNHRDQPDISLFASPGFDGTGYVYCQSDQTISGVRTCDVTANNGFLDFGVVGGTSASAPAFAGIMALVNQYQTAHGGTNRQGNANYVLYALAKKAGASCTSSATEAAGCIFNDVTKGNSFLPTGLPGVGTNSVPCQGGSLNCSVSTVGNTGVLVDPSHTTTEAWTATAGYDMTSGLGTVNANNLATNWGSVSTIPTTTTLTLSPTSGITHGTGENVAVGITVKSNTGTAAPAGDVSLIATFPDGTTQGFDHFTLVSGAVSGVNTQSLPGGTYTVSAHYAGDGTNAPSDSSPVSVTVGQEASQTFIVVPSFDSQGNLLNGNATSVTYGSRYIIRMYVTDKNGVASTTGPPSPTCFTENLMTCPTGTISLTANGSPVDAGAFKLNNAGYTRDIAPTLTGGPYSFVAQYAGDNSYSASSGTYSFTVKPDPVSFGLQVPNSLIAGVPFQASIAAYAQYPGAAATTGTMTFYDGTTQLGNAVSINGYPGSYQSAFFVFANLTIATAGSHTISAQYSGDANYAPFTATTTVNVLNPTTASVTFRPSTVNYGSPVTITGVIDTPVAASNAALKPTGTISLYAGYDGQITSGVSVTMTVGQSGNWEIQVSATFTPSTSESFGISYNGDTNYAAVSAQSNFLTVIIPDFSLNIPAAPFNITAGQLGTLQISVVPATNNSSPVKLSCVGNLPSGYSCSLQPSTVNLANGATSTAVLTLSPPSGAALAHNAFASKSSAFLFPYGPNPLWPLSLLSGLAALLFLRWACKSRDLRPSLGFGLVFVISLVIGCGGGSSAVPPPPPPPPGPFATSTTVTTSLAKVAQNTPVTLTAKVTGQGNLTGNVGFYANGGWIGVSNLVGNMATLNVALPFPGVYSITAYYGGDSNNSPSTSPGVSEAVTGITIMQVNAQTSTLFHSVSVTVTLQ
ncbi:MAG TPA: Ig-like domain repeat protein [Candidatus Polarisedimenticolia bacterium]|nr:Ig-like domain repeat protein [Candidatus Polarisedimenticolia bacterium]